MHVSPLHRKAFTHLLHDTATISTKGQGQDVPFHLFRQDALLHLAAMLKHLLNDLYMCVKNPPNGPSAAMLNSNIRTANTTHIVTKHIGHELTSVRQELFKHAFLLLAACAIKLFLDESAAMLIAAEFDNVAIDIRELKAPVLRIPTAEVL